MFTREFKEPRTLKLLVQLIKVPRVNPLERVASLKKSITLLTTLKLLKQKIFENNFLQETTSLNDKFRV